MEDPWWEKGKNQVGGEGLNGRKGRSLGGGKGEEPSGRRGGVLVGEGEESE